MRMICQALHIMHDTEGCDMYRGLIVQYFPLHAQVEQWDEQVENGTFAGKI